MLAGLVVVVRAVLGDPEIVERRFFASATAPTPLAGFEVTVDRLAVVDVAVLPVDLALVEDVEAFRVGLGLDVLVVVPAGFRTLAEGAATLPRFSANDSDLIVVWLDPEGARDVLLAAAASGFFFSSPEPPPIEVVDLCPALEDVGPVALLAGFRMAELAAGRVGGLLKPPVALVVEAVEDAAGFVADEVDDAPGRLAAAAPGRFGGTFSFFTPFVVSLTTGSFSGSASTSDITPVVSPSESISCGASSARMASGVSTSVILLAIGRNVSET